MMLTRLIVFGVACFAIHLPMTNANCQKEYDSCVEVASKSCIPKAENECEKECENPANERIQDPNIQESQPSCMNMCLVVKETECRSECQSNYLTCYKNCEDNNKDKPMSVFQCLFGITVPTMPVV